MALSVAAFRAVVDLSIEIAECGHCASYCDECCTQHKQLCFQDRSTTTLTPAGLPIALYGMTKTASSSRIGFENQLFLQWNVDVVHPIT